jgi:arsenate reductase
LSEAITNQLASGMIEAKSAGSQPAGEVHPLSIHYLTQQGFSTEGLRSQSWDEFIDFAPDLVITLCDSALNETCPVYFTNSTKVHWGLTDPSKLEAEGGVQDRAFLATINEIKKRVEQLKIIAEKGLNQTELKLALANIGAH